MDKEIITFGYIKVEKTFFSSSKFNYLRRGRF